MISQFGFVDWDTNSLGDSGSVVWVNLVEESNHGFLEFSLSLRQWARQVLDQISSVLVCEHISPKLSWLFKVVIWMVQLESSYLASNVKLMPSIFWIFNWSTK